MKNRYAKQKNFFRILIVAFFVGGMGKIEALSQEALDVIHSTSEYNRLLVKDQGICVGSVKAEPFSEHPLFKARVAHRVFWRPEAVTGECRDAKVPISRILYVIELDLRFPSEVEKIVEEFGSVYSSFNFQNLMPKMKRINRKSTRPSTDPRSELVYDIKLKTKTLLFDPFEKSFVGLIQRTEICVKDNPFAEKFEAEKKLYGRVPMYCDNNGLPPRIELLALCNSELNSEKCRNIL